MFHFKCENNKKEKKGRQSKNKAEIPKENKAPEFQPFFFVLVCNLICSISQIAPAQLTPIGPTHGQKGEGPSEPWRLKWAPGVQEINHTRQIFSYISFFGGGWIQNYRVNRQRTGKNTQISKRKAMMGLWAWRKITLKNPAYKGQENRKIERKLL